MVKKYIGKTTGLSRAQVTRLVCQYKVSGAIQARKSAGRKFGARYGPKDIALLAEVDEAHETLSGPATRRLLDRGWTEYADARYENMAKISASHIYNLRKRRMYRERRSTFEKTRPGSGASPLPGASPAISGWTRCIRAIWTERRGFTTGNRFAIPTFPQSRPRLFLSQTTNKTNPMNEGCQSGLLPLLQAHPWIRKDLS